MLKMKSFLLLVLGLFITNSFAWTGHQCTVPVVKQVSRSECVYKNINCDPRHLDLTCCLNKTLLKEESELKDQCCFGNVDSMCNITSCLSCNDTQICDYSGNTCYDAPPNNVLIKLILSKINRGSNTTESELLVYNDIWWTNTQGFNQYQLDLDIIQQPTPAKTINRCTASIDFIKVMKGSRNYSGSFDSSLNGHHLNFEEINFDKHFDHGDFLQTTITCYYSRTVSNIYKSMLIHFDYEPPTHCSETGTCQSGSIKPLSLNKDASKVPISLKWEGWSDSLSGIDHYSLSIYKLFTDGDGNLREPLEPLKTVSFSNMTLTYTYQPTDSGIYSFVLAVEDLASNRKYARQLAIYDPNSAISLGTDNGELMYISSSNPNSNNSWQSSKTEIIVNWTNHFVNWNDVNGSFLKRFDTKPVNGVYNYFITDNMDDHSGKRSLDAVQNINGIVQFKYGYTQNTGKRPTTWEPVSPLKETILLHFENGSIHDNDYMVVWVKAIDIIGNEKIDSTRINFDSTPPNMNDGTVVTFKRSNTFSSSMSIHVFDTESGINHIEVQIQTDKEVKLWSRNFPGNKSARNSCIRRPGSCACGNSNLRNECYNFLHVMKIDHCGILPPPSIDDILNLHIHIYNNAYLVLEKVIKIGPASSLKGLGVYDPPVNIHTDVLTPTSVRLSWSFPASCYQITSVRIENEISGQINLSKNITSYDVAGLQPRTSYDFIFTVFYETDTSQPTTFSVKTNGDNPLSYILTVTVESLVIVSFVIVAIYIFKKRKFKTITTTHVENRISAPPNKYTSQQTKMSDLQRKERSNSTTASTAGPLTKLEQVVIESSMTLNSEEQPIKSQRNVYEAANNHPDFDENLYEDLSSQEPSHQCKDISRKNIIMDEVIFNGTYSNIVKGYISTEETMPVAVRIPDLNGNDKDIKEFEDLIKTIKEYMDTQIGTHQNILSYIVQFPGGNDIFNEPPLMVMELCDQGSLNEWLQEYGENGDIDVNTLHYIGFGVAYGMEYLKIRGIFHGNLCSENVLLTSELVPKIKGFGRCISEKSKKYKKSMPPECLESEYLDPCEAVDSWAYGILLWEIFSPGEIPYDDVADDKLLEELKNGYRLPDSKYALAKHDALIKHCLNQDKKQRPTFHDIVEVMAEPINDEPQDNEEIVEEQYYSNA